MRKLLVLILLTIFLSGCVTYNLNFSNFVLPDDAEFLALVQELNTPKKVCNYMEYNFTPIEYNKYDYTPYQMWKIQIGDCSDYSKFAIFCANYNGWEVYYLFICYGNYSHLMGIYKTINGYLVSDWDYLHPRTYNNFNDVLFFYNSNWTYYLIYDYEMNLIEKRTK